MKVKKIMTKGVKSCRPKDKLSIAAKLMWCCDCGVVPLVGKDKKVLGMITDRDICIAVSTRNQLPSEIDAGDLATKQVISCRPNDTVKKALKKMGKYQVKRLPVVGKSEMLVGIISFSDIARFANKKSLKKRVLKTITAIGKPHPILLKEI